ncbi:MAG: integrin alpha [Gammaproteobacteria bacterium]
MHINKRFTYPLILVSMLLLTGADGFKCSDDDDNDDSSRGTSNTSIQVIDEQKISADSGGFNGNLDKGDQFGSAVADPGDLEADGVGDLAVGTPFDDDDGKDRGAVWMLFMDDNGLVDQEQKISSDAGDFAGDLDDDDLFGSAVAGIDDLDGDGAFDLAVGAPGGDENGPERGEVWILFLDSEGKVLREQKISDSDGDFNGDLDDDDRFGSAIAAIGDVNGDGITDLAVGAPNDDDGSNNAGAVWILFMRMDGSVDAWQKVSDSEGSFGGSLDGEDHFGAAVAGIGDLDDDGIPDLVVGAPGGDKSGPDRGEVWVLFLDSAGKVRDEQRIADSDGGFEGALADDDSFGSAVANVGDLNGDGIPDLGVGAPNDDDSAANAGAVWILIMKTDGRVDAWQKLSGEAGGFNGNLEADDHFGAAIAGMGNINNSGLADLAVGTPGDDDGDTDQGAVWILFMDTN